MLQLQRIVGLLLIIAAVFGLLFALAGLYLVPRYSNEVGAEVRATLQAVDETLDTTALALDVTDDALAQSSNTLASFQSLTLGVAQGVNDTIPLLNTAATVVGEDLPDILEVTQRSLEAAEEGATAIDLVLRRMSTSPFFGAVPYEPDIPLYESLADVSASLEPLPDALESVERTIEVSGDNLTLVEGDIRALAATLTEIDNTITEARLVVEEYVRVVEQQKSIVARVQENVDAWLIWVVRATWLLLLWFAIAQVGLLSQGIEMVARSRAKADEGS